MCIGSVAAQVEWSARVSGLLNVIVAVRSVLNMMSVTSPNLSPGPTLRGWQAVDKSLGERFTALNAVIFAVLRLDRSVDRHW